MTNQITVCADCKFVIHKDTRYYPRWVSRCECPELLEQNNCQIDNIDGGYLNNCCTTFVEGIAVCPYFKAKVPTITICERSAKSKKGLFDRMLDRICKS